MPRSRWFSLLPLGLYVIGACGDNALPTQPKDFQQGTPAPQPSLSSELSASATGNFWTLKAPFPAHPEALSRLGSSVASANNASGKPTLYVFGGVDEVGHSWGNHAYDPESDRWATSRGLPLGTAYTNGVGKIGNKLYIAGGMLDPYYNPRVLASLFVFNPATHSMIRRADMPRPTANGVSGVIDGKLYVLAGFCLSSIPDPRTGYSVACRSLYRYNPLTNTWATLARAPHHHQAGAGGVIKGKFYAAGGYSLVNVAPTRNLDVYDPVTNTWKTLAPLPEGRANVAGAVLGNKLYVIGGQGSGPNATNKVFAFDPTTNTWRSRAPLLRGTTRTGAAPMTFSGQPHIFTVSGSGGPPSNQMYTP